MIESVSLQPQIRINPSFKQKSTSNDVKANCSAERNISYEAADSLKSQVLYSSNSKDNKFIEYLKPGMDKNTIIENLCNKDKMGDSAFNKLFANHIAYLITNSKNPELSTKNFNIIMNTKDVQITKPQTYMLLLTANRVNDGKQQSANGFSGGELTKENIETILKEQQQGLQGLGDFAMGMAIGMNI